MSTNCSVCENPIAGNYCSNCGQQITNKTAGFFGLIMDFLSNFFSVNKSFIGTSKKLLSNPKFIVENFYQGNKRYFVSPGSFILYGITLIAIHSLFFGPVIFNITMNVEGLGLQYVFWIFLLPFIILASLFTFLRQGVNLSKHIISISYLSCVFLFIFLILEDILLTIYGELELSLSLIFFLVFTFIWNSFVFSSKRKIGYHLLNTIIQLLIFSAITGAVIILIQSLSAN